MDTILHLPNREKYLCSVKSTLLQNKDNEIGLHDEDWNPYKIFLCTTYVKNVKTRVLIGKIGEFKS